MAVVEDSKVLIDTGASDAAFRAGQMFARLLVDRALEAAGERNESVIRVDDIWACVERVVGQEFLEQVRADANVEFGGKQKERAA